MKRVVNTLVAMTVLGIFSAEAQAQFHKKKKDGGTEVNEQARAAIAAGQQQAANANGEVLQMNFATMGDGFRVPTQSSAVFKPSKVWDGTAWVERDVRLGHMDKENVFVFSKLVTHSDGSYTESERDNKRSNFGKNKPMIQTTKSANGIILRTREIIVDDTGFPKEVMIRDANGILKFRGEMIYERLALAQKFEGEVASIQRLKEERLFSPDKQLVRRIVHNYDPSGRPEPDVVHDYVENIPKDLKLVVTEGDPQEDPLLNQEPTRGDKINPFKKLLGKDKKKQESETGPVSEKKGFLGFGRRNN